MRWRPAILTLSLIAAISIYVASRERAPSISAADSEDVTWGAVEPTWSPDGERIAFSLFGSIWAVPRGGGAAGQITSSRGYHAHPAWSPDGGQIAFIQGGNPRGRLPKTPGKLCIVDVESGREREIALSRPTAGTPAWAPDGKKIAVGLLIPGAGSLLHEVDLETAEAVQLQHRLQRSPVGPWVEAAWNPKHEELFFAAQRLGEPQIWSMPAGWKGMMIQMPLTVYLPEHIAMIDSLAALPDGSGAVYSVVEVNGRGNYELYRVAREGGEWVPVTETTRDEFNPAISPDGKLIAHASNHMGNLDIFTMPVEGGEKKHVRITELKFRQPQGQVRVRVLDETGQPSPARLYVEASDGKAYAPRGEPIFYYPFEPGNERPGFFVASGDDAFPAPIGRLKLTAIKGIEYRIEERSVNVPEGDIAEVAIHLQRWTNWEQRGWYSGENHFHANYNGGYYQKPPDSLAWLQAEDLNAANMIVANASGAFVHDKEFFTGSVSPLSTGRFFLYWGQEYRNSNPLGHMGFLNIKKLVPPFYTSVIGSDSPYDFPLNTMAALEAKAQGGLVTYMHPITGGLNDVFDTNLGAKESVVTAALGGLDTLDLLPFGQATYHLWYRLLNCGLRISAGAGTDAFTNWRGINRIPGSSRQYVHVNGAMSWERWIERYREGRSFATNGPLVDFTVNGQAPGSVIQASAGQPYPARLTAKIESLVPLTKIEFLRNGQVIHSGDLPSSTPLQTVVEHDFEVDRSSWLAVRLSGPPGRGVTVGPAMAHSSPVYVDVGGQPTLIREDLETAIRWVDRLWRYLEERDNLGPGDNRERAKAMIDRARAHYVEKLRLAQ